MRYSSAQLEKDIKELDRLLEKYNNNMEGGAKRKRKAKKTKTPKKTAKKTTKKGARKQKGGRVVEGRRTFRMHTIEGRAVPAEEGGTYVIKEAGTPLDAARKAFKAACRRGDKEAKKTTNCALEFTIIEKTRGSDHKVYGPYKGRRTKLAKPVEVQGIKGGPKIVRKFKYDVELMNK